MNRRTALLLATNLAVLALFAWFLRHVGMERLTAPWRLIAPPAIALAVLSQLASYGLRALRIYLAERDIPRGRYLDCLRLILVNNAANLLLPARAGEVSFPLLMRRWFGVDLARATGTLIWLRLLDLHVLAAVGGIAAAFGWIGAAAGVSRVALSAGALATVSPLLLFALHRPLREHLEGRDGRIAPLLRRGLAGVPDRGRTLALDLVLTWSTWGVKLAALGGLLAALAGLPPALGLLGAIGGDLSTVLPVHAPGGLGTYELGAMALLTPGVEESHLTSTLAAVVNLHLLILTIALFAGAVAWLLAPRRGARNP